MSIAAFTKPIEKKVKKTIVTLLRDDQTAMEVDAIVFYAMENLDIGTGYGTALQLRGGLVIKKECEAIGSIKMGEAVVTTSGEMKCGSIIHACGPKFLEPDMEKKLRECMQNTLKLANEKGMKTISFPPMGTGFYGVPLDMCATVMLDCIREAVNGDTSLEEITICVIDKPDFNAFKDKVEKL